ncbi:sigma-70 family RNA polymerase sigma factor [Egibacter rhizosphaerae]|nr:sigma-70 family RNA polymerase sigma factor [Egibacter rhizosphaerae]
MADPSASHQAASARAASLDEGTWRELLRRLGGFVRKRVADRDDADDIVADVLLRIHERIETLDDRDRLLPWVFQITRNAIVDHHRAVGRQREQPTDTVPEPLEPGEEDDAETAALRAEVVGCLAPLLDRLDTPYREALELVEERGLTHTEAAERVGISVSGMKSRVQRARRQVASELDRCCEFALDGRGSPIGWRKRAGTPEIRSGASSSTGEGREDPST